MDITRGWSASNLGTEGLMKQYTPINGIIVEPVSSIVEDHSCVVLMGIFVVSTHDCGIESFMDIHSYIVIAQNAGIYSI